MNADLISTITKWIYNIISTTKSKIPLFVIALHVYITNLAFKTEQSLAAVVGYVVALAVFCIIWESSYAIWATTQVKSLWYSKMFYILFVSATRFFNLVSIALFTTSGLPLTYIVPISTVALTVIFSVIIVINYIIDIIEQNIWPENWKKMYNIEDTEETKIDNQIDQGLDMTIGPTGPSSNV